jgi:3-keto-L-gulonate-6-phosphate decarboxylase
MIVAGSAIFGSEDPVKAAGEIRKIMQHAHAKRLSLIDLI